MKNYWCKTGCASAGPDVPVRDQVDQVDQVCQYKNIVYDIEQNI